MNKQIGKFALVSGGSKGIGLACAKKLASEGWNIFLVSSNSANLELAKSDIMSEYGVNVVSFEADLSTLLGCESTVKAALEMSDEFDILVNSAGATRGGIFPEQSDSEMVEGFALKFHGAVRLCRLMWPVLSKRNGTVVNIVGGFARTPSADFMVGGSVNAALANFSKALAEQGLRDGVNVNWIHPGLTETERLEGIFADRAEQQGKTVEQVRKESVTAEGVRRLGQPEDIAELVAFLCGPKGRHINGSGIVVDGGGSKGYY